MKKLGGLAISLAVVLVFGAANEALAEAEQVPALIRCSELSYKPERNPAITVAFTLNFSENTFSAERSTASRPGKEVYYGSIKPGGIIKIFGRGAYFGSHDAWRYQFTGSTHSGDPVLSGMMHMALHPNVTRTCTLSFLASQTKLASIFGETKKQEAPTQQPMATVEAKPVENNPKEHVSSQISENAKASGIEQLKLSQQQAATASSLDQVESLLGGIILPPSEDPSSWMMRVAAVPVQQQQFCRIVDRFYDNLAKVYLAHNDIMKNSLFRERKEDMANLLPSGHFANWVVQVKEVEQAADGSVAVMLQPPCRAMLGSDACQKDGSRIRATIPVGSPLYNELSKVSAGDFVIASGKILYAESVDAGQPLPAYAVYQAGSHCSSVEETKQEDVFVTEISYLVRLR